MRCAALRLERSPTPSSPSPRSLARALLARHFARCVSEGKRWDFSQRDMLDLRQRLMLDIIVSGQALRSKSTSGNEMVIRGEKVPAAASFAASAALTGVKRGRNNTEFNEDAHTASVQLRLIPTVYDGEDSDDDEGFRRRRKKTRGKRSKTRHG